MKNDLEQTVLERIMARLAEMRETAEVIQKDISEIKLSQVRTEVNVAEHMRRTEAAEKRLEVLQGAVVPLITRNDNINGASKAIIFLGGIIMGLATLCGIVWEIVRK